MQEDAIWKILLGIHTCMPGIITSYDPKKVTATVTPGLKRKYRSKKTAEELSTIFDAPVYFPRFGSVAVRPPAKEVKGPCIIVFSQRSIDRFMQTARPEDPLDSRRFALSDGFVFPGLSTEKNVFTGKNDNSLEIIYDKATFEITEAGKFRIANQNAELIDVISKLVKALKIATVSTALGPQGFLGNTITAITEAETALAQLGELSS